MTRLAEIALAVTGVALTLLAAEWLLAVFAPVPFSVEKNMYFVADPYTGYRLKPNGVGHFSGGFAANANRHGHRSDELSAVKEPGTFRILVLGDSYTVGASVAQSAAYPAVLQARLRAEAGRAGRRFEVVNAGVGGWQPFQYAQYYQHYGPELEPDLVVVGLFVGNDLDQPVTTVDALPSAVLGRRISREAFDDRWISAKVALHEHSHLARRLWSRPPQPPSFRRESCDALPDFLIRIQRGRRDNHLRDSPRLAARATGAVRQLVRIQRLTEPAGVDLLVVLLPDENQLNAALQAQVFPDLAAYDLGLPQSLLRERLALAGIDTLDLLADFRSEPRCLFQNDTHWTEEGHALVADRIFERLGADLCCGSQPRPQRVRATRSR